MLLNQDLKVVVVLSTVLLIYGAVWLAIRQLSLNKKQRMLTRYSELRKQSLELQKITSNYILSEDVSDKTLKEGITCTDFYRQLKQGHVANLSVKSLQKIKHSNNLLLLQKAEYRLKSEEQRLKEARLLISYVLAG